MADRIVRASREVHAPAERIFELIADPARQLLGRTDVLFGNPRGMGYGTTGVESVGDLAAMILVGLTVGHEPDAQAAYAALRHLPDGG